MKRLCGCGGGDEPAKCGTKEQERVRIVESFDVFGLGDRARGDILEALDSDLWDWYRDCDGCTMVSEIFWPNKYFPPCLRHDFDWMRGKGYWAASRRFYELQRAYGIPIWRSALRSGAVTIVWYTWSRWAR